jgi:hypothetical protein
MLSKDSMVIYGGAFMLSIIPHALYLAILLESQLYLSMAIGFIIIIK